MNLAWHLIAVQGEIGPDGEICRYPADESPPLLPFTPMIQRIRQKVETVLGQSFNYALIQLYRDGPDNLCKHFDKILDFVRCSHRQSWSSTSNGITD